MDPRGRYLCETCFDTLTNHVVDVRGFEEAVCDACIGAYIPREARFWEVLESLEEASRAEQVADGLMYDEELCLVQIPPATCPGPENFDPALHGRRAVMRRGRPPQLVVTLSPEERTVLAHLVRQTTVPLVQARPARLILLLDAGHRLTEAAALVGLSRVRAYKWVHRFEREGLRGLRGLRARPQGGRHPNARALPAADARDPLRAAAAPSAHAPHSN